MKIHYFVLLSLILLFSRNTKTNAQEGRILMEYWYNINGTTISSLTSNPRFPNNPSGRTYINNLQSPANIGENYGTRIRGYVIPPATGDYTFWASQDDKSEIWLSTDENPLNKVKILKPTVTSLPDQWAKNSSQKSATINLIAKRKYYIEIIHKENTGKDHIAVGWTLPNGTHERPISGQRISPYTVAPTIPENFLSSISDHPRIQLSSLDFYLIKEKLKAGDVSIMAWNKKIKGYGDGILNEPTSTYVKSDGVRLLTVSRAVLDRIIILTYLCNTDPDTVAAKKYASRAYSELLAVANFPDWNPSHFLDVGEMAHAFAIGYDRLYNYMTPAQRTIIKNAIVTKALNPFITAHGNTEWWTKSKNNWNYVCNSGVALAALSIGSESELSNKVLSLATQSIKTYSLHSFGPDGGWEEGPMYWGYTIKYLSALLSGLETSIGGDLGFGSAPGISEAGTFPIYLTGTCNELFNFSDGTPELRVVNQYSMYYMASRFNKPEYAWYQSNVIKGNSAYNIMWQTPAIDPTTRNFPKDKLFEKIGVATMRSSWNDPKAIFVGIKTGNNDAGHSNLDNGSFVFDALGYRWAMDLGSENYNLPGMFGDQRFDYYRMRAEGQNTLVFNPSLLPGQVIKGIGKISSHTLNTSSPTVVTDLTPVYSNQTKKVTRTFTFQNRTNLVIQDQIETSIPSSVYWFMHTKASISLSADKKSATLYLGAEKLIVSIKEGPADAKFSVMAAKPLGSSPNPANQNANTGVMKLCITAGNISLTKLSVLLSPVINSSIQEGMEETTSVSSTTENAGEVFLYPNPAKDYLIVDLTEHPNQEGPSFKIFDSNSINYYVSYSSEHTGNYKIDISHLKSGIYFLEIKTNMISKIKKIVVE